MRVKFVFPYIGSWKHEGENSRTSSMPLVMTLVQYDYYYLRVICAGVQIWFRCFLFFNWNLLSVLLCCTLLLTGTGAVAFHNFITFFILNSVFLSCCACLKYLVTSTQCAECYKLFFFRSILRYCVLLLQEWPEEVYPPYANGPAYVISSDIVTFILSQHKDRRLRVS